MSKDKDSQSSSTHHDNALTKNEKKREELDRRRALKTILGASSLMVINPFSMNAESTGMIVSLTPSVSPTQSPTSSLTPSVSPSNSITPSVSPSISVTPSVSPSATVTPTISPSTSVTPSISPTVTPSITQSLSPSTTVTPTISPSTSVTPSLSPTVTPSITQSPSATVTPTISPSTSVTPSLSPTITPSITQSPSATVTPTISPSTSVTPSLSPTVTPSLTQSQTPTPTPSVSSAVLPVELSEFDVREENGVILLYWKTESERNNKGFEVQRSTNTFTYKKIGWVDGAGNANSPLSYNFEEINVEPNQWYYYRLRQIDFDGRSELSKTIAILINQEGKTVLKDISPNIVTNHFVNVEIMAGVVDRVELFIHSVNGQLVANKNFTLSKGNNTIQMDLNNASSGIYIVSAKFDKSKRQTKKFVIKR